jgi:hypothetical protein
VGDAGGSEGDWMGGPVVLELKATNQAELALKP